MNVIDFAAYKKRKAEERANFALGFGITDEMPDEELDTVLKIVVKYIDVDPKEWDLSDLETFVGITQKYGKTY